MTHDTDADQPRMGDFTRPSKPRSKQQAKPAPEKEPEVDAVEQEAAQLEADGHMPPKSDEEAKADKTYSMYEEMQKALEPVSDYKTFLKENKVSEEKAAEVVDNLMSRGYHEETYHLSRSASVRFRTREFRDTLRLRTALEVQKPVYTDHINEITSRYNLASSLVRFREDAYVMPTAAMSDDEADKIFYKRLQAVDTLAAPVLGKMWIKLAKFDQLIATVMREGVAENF